VQLKVELIRRADHLLIEGFIVDLAPNHVDDFANLWLEQLRMVEADDKFWDWAFKRDFVDRNEEYEGYAIDAEGCTQGLMKIETQRHGSIEALGRRLVYIVSTAIPVLEGILARRDLYAEQYIQNHEVLRDLLHEVLNYEDWEEIASAAARAVRERVLNERW